MQHHTTQNQAAQNQAVKHQAMQLIAITNLSKSYGDNQVLNSVSLKLHLGQKVGLVGANGVGKSTLLKIIVGVLQPDSGHLTLSQKADVGYLPQILEAAETQTIHQLLDTTLGNLKRIEARLRQLEEEMAQVGGPEQGQALDLDQIFAEYSELSEQFERRGGYDLAYRLDQVFAGLGIGHIDRERRIQTLSGGEKSRIGLAALLLRSPDLLLLDEPTNHLDFAALAWLESYLQGYQGGVLVVSHDRQFLNKTIDQIVEIDEHTREANTYPGNYDAYAQRKTQERVKWAEAYWQQQEEVWALRKVIKGKARQVAHNRTPRDNEKFAYAAKGERVQDAISRNVKSAEEKLRRIAEDPIPKPPQSLKINPDFNPQSLSSKTPISVSEISKSYGEQKILQKLSFAVNSASRIVIIGPNGAGKSTLLKILAGVIQPDHGELNRASSTIVGYLDQEQETLDDAGTIFDAYRSGRIGDWETFKVELLRYGLFVYPDLQKAVATLSVGQKRKLQIARLIAQQANLLLLDEPTNHISLDVLEEFEKALIDFPGPVIAISHDRRFLARFAEEIWEIRDGTLYRTLGGWARYQEVYAA